jgi:hypothetical protein
MMMKMMRMTRTMMKTRTMKTRTVMKMKKGIIIIIKRKTQGKNNYSYKKKIWFTKTTKLFIT